MSGKVAEDVAGFRLEACPDKPAYVPAAYNIVDTSTGQHVGYVRYDPYLDPINGRWCGSTKGYICVGRDSEQAARRVWDHTMRRRQRRQAP